jgi:hypothetical protein
LPNKNRRAGISFREYLLKNMTFYFPSISGKPLKYFWEKGWIAGYGFRWYGIQFIRYSTK